MDLNSQAQKAFDLIEFSTKSLLVTGKAGTGKSFLALAAALFAGNPAQAQNPLVNKVGNFLKKLQPTVKVDTVKVQKDTPLVLAKFKDYKGAGYGYAKSPNEATAYKIAKNITIINFSQYN